MRPENSNQKYTALGAGDDNEDGNIVDHPELRRAQWYFHPLSVLPWISTLAFALLSMALYLRRQTSNTFGSYEEGFHTDPILPEAIPIELVRFKGTPQYDIEGKGFREAIDPSAPWPENRQFFGEPSPSVDSNWARLLEGRYFSISAEEAKRAWGKRYLDFVDQGDGGWTAGLDVFHTLHCLNTVRQAVHPDYYNKSGPLHLDHCMDAIRQYIQCAGSTTLVPTKFWEGIHQNYIDTDQIRTCRSFSYLREWTDSRQPGMESHVSRDISVLDPRKHQLVMEHRVAMQGMVNKLTGNESPDHHTHQ